MKQVKVHAMLGKVGDAPLAQWTNGQPLTVAYGWVRNASYAVGAPTAYATMAV